MSFEAARIAPGRPAASPWPERPLFALADAPAMLWRERRLAMVVFLSLLAVGVLAAFAVKRTYQAHAGLLVGLGPAYVYDPAAGDAGRGTVPAPTAVLDSERDILESQALKLQVIGDLGFARLEPVKARAYARADPAGRRKLVDEAARDIARKLQVDTAPDTSVIRLTYTDEDPGRAAAVLNALTADYLVLRRKVLVDAPQAGALDAERQAFQQRLDDADARYQAFLAQNRLGDFAASRAALAAVQTQVEEQRSTVAAQLREAQARAGGFAGELARLPVEVTLQRDLDNSAAAKLGGLKADRTALLSRYRPDATPVRALDAQIAALEGGITSGAATGPAAVRTGANPVRQSVETDALSARAEAAALSADLANLDAQAREVADRSLHLAALEPQFDALSRERDLDQANVRDFAAKADQARAASAIAEHTHDDIRLIERPLAPAIGRSLRGPILALSLLFAAFSAACAGVLRGLSRPGLRTPRAAARTYALPVLGAATLRR